jgi:hypothetical protein
MSAPRAGRNPFWGLVVLSAAGFCIAVLAYVAAGFGNGAHPLHRFFNRHGAAVTIGLAIATILFGGLALTIDRMQTQRHASDQSPKQLDKEDG